MGNKLAGILASTLMCCVSIASSLRAESAAAVFAAAETQYQKGDYENALAGYRSVIAQFPNDWRANQARFTEGFILQKKLKQLTQAREAFQKVADRPAPDGLAPHALYHIASVDEQSGETDKAIQSYADFIARSKGHAREKIARRKLDFLKRRKDNPKATEPGWAQNLKKRFYRKLQREFDTHAKGAAEPKN